MSVYFIAKNFRGASATLPAILLNIPYTFTRNSNFRKISFSFLLHMWLFFASVDKLSLESEVSKNIWCVYRGGGTKSRGPVMGGRYKN